MPELFDIHSHLNLPDFNKDREEVISRFLDAKIWTIIVGNDAKTSEMAVEIAGKYDGIFSSVGLHPTEKPLGNWISKLRELAKHPKVVAIGECGLDMFRQKKEDLERQREIFIKQIELAIELNKPLMIHVRDALPLTPERSDGGRAHKETLEILDFYKNKNFGLKGNIHFFSGNWEQAKKYFDLEFTISFAGLITFVDNYNEVIKKAPLNKIMIETDAPFVAPVPHRGKRNEPLYVCEIAKKIAEIRGISYEEAAIATTNNALNFFSIRDNCKKSIK